MRDRIFRVLRASCNLFPDPSGIPWRPEHVIGRSRYIRQYCNNSCRKSTLPCAARFQHGIHPLLLSLRCNPDTACSSSQSCSSCLYGRQQEGRILMHLSGNRMGRIFRLRSWARISVIVDHRLLLHRRLCEGRERQPPSHSALHKPGRLRDRAAEDGPPARHPVGQR